MRGGGVIWEGWEESRGGIVTGNLSQVLPSSPSVEVDTC